jgi:hypothetical protein
LDLEDASITGYEAAIKAAASAGYPVLIIDSLSHGWQELLTEVDKLAKAKYNGNTWSAWSDGTPKQRRLVEAILSYPGHVLATMRSKTEWSIETTERGKNKPVRVGLAPEQGKGIEYEFDLLLEMSPDHIGTVIKDRTGQFQDKMLEKPGEDFGKDLSAWLSDGPPPIPKPTKEQLLNQLREAVLMMSLDELREEYKRYGAAGDTEACEIVKKRADTLKLKDQVPAEETKDEMFEFALDSLLTKGDARKFYTESKAAGHSEQDLKRIIAKAAQLPAEE